MATAASSSTTYSPSQSLERRQLQHQRRRVFQELDWKRSDGREFHQCRPAFLRTGAANAAAGSAYVEFGTTKVIVSVFGPRESKKAMMYSDIGRLNCNVSYTTFSTSIRGQGSDHKEYSSMLHKALEGAIIVETFPKTTVDVFALVLESGRRPSFSSSFSMGTGFFGSGFPYDNIGFPNSILYMNRLHGFLNIIPSNSNSLPLQTERIPMTDHFYYASGNTTWCSAYPNFRSFLSTISFTRC